MSGQKRGASSLRTSWQALRHRPAQPYPPPQPPRGEELKEREGFDTKVGLSEWFHENSKVLAEVYWDYQLVINYMEPQARKGVEPFASWLKVPGDAPIPGSPDPGGISVVVVGGETNAYWFAADFAYLTSRSIDEWR